MSNKEDPAAYYDEYGEREWERLERDFYHRLEWEETSYFLSQYLPDTGRVLDVGGGAGRYSVWLAEKGYEVVLVDPSERQVELAEEKVVEHNVAERISVEVGDVRDLQFASHCFDATLCLGGPLSHVLSEDDRRTAANELARVTTAGGPVFASVMGRLAAVQTIVRHAGRLPEEHDETELLPQLSRTGDYDVALLETFDREPTAPSMHLFRATELESLLESADLTVEVVTGLESVVSQRRDDFDSLGESQRAALRETVHQFRGDRGVADLSGHMLAVAFA